ncbi:hypothetical protein K8F61_17235 [Microbacterium resistens]|uniref:Uncharacterized protein n=1 Tax=Microbacterium resistens TaxID=156977 RepID=A0ABY3RTR8_9MICO|nr:hypothetical protein [Microbacterium resistens]UGS26348.1 hypothetical protein K8F61_17235 [Microbacterium resistens]
MIEAMVDAAGESATPLALSIVALAVSALAAGFTGWQAYGEHAARSRARRASWVFETQRRSPADTRYHNWLLRNAGGGSATDVTLTVGTPLLGKTEQVYRAASHVPPGGAALLVRGLGGLPSSLHNFDEERGGWALATDRASRETGVRIFDQWGVVSWTDERGKSRTQRIPLY